MGTPEAAYLPHVKGSGGLAARGGGGGSLVGSGVSSASHLGQATQKGLCSKFHLLPLPALKSEGPSWDPPMPGGFCSLFMA